MNILDIRNDRLVSKGIKIFKAWILLCTLAAVMVYYGIALHKERKHVVQGSPAKVTKVLIISYHRSGSTLAGEVFNRNTNAFYWFEPLFVMKHAFDRNQSFKGQTRIQQDNSSMITLSEPYIDAATDLIVQILNCQLEKIDLAVLRQYFLSQWVTSEKMRSYRDCLHSHSANYWSDDVIKKCRVKTIDSACLSSSVRAIKSIRVQLHFVPYLLKKDPDIHIIHYIRDPRGILISRYTLGNTIKSTSALVQENAYETCATLLVDVLWKEKLETRNIIFLPIRYEDLCVFTEAVVNQIYTFVGLKTPHEVVGWFKNNTRASESNGAAGTTRTNSTAVAYRWKDYLPADIWNEVNAVCWDVLKAYQYLSG